MKMQKFKMKNAKWKNYINSLIILHNNDMKCKIPPNLPLPKGGIIPLFGKGRLGGDFQVNVNLL
jgi:hypothetical protein